MTDLTARTTAASRRFLAGAREDQPALAAALMVASLFLLGLQDSLVKLTSSDVSIWQFQLLRSICNLVLLIAMSRLLWGTTLPAPKRFWAVALRSLFLVCSMIFFFGGVPFLSLSEIAAGLYVFPLFVAVLSALLLDEQVGRRRVIAILTGFAGTVLILKPGTEVFKWVSLMPVTAGLFYASTILSTRKLCRDESPVTLAYGVSIAFVLIGTAGIVVTTFASPTGIAIQWPYLFTGWHPLGVSIAGIIVFCSLINLTANIGLAKAYQSAESSWLVPFDYSYLIFATFWGVVMWGDVPDLLSFAGMSMIAGAGCYVAWRERRDSRLQQAEMNRILR